MASKEFLAIAQSLLFEEVLGDRASRWLGEDSEESKKGRATVSAMPITTAPVEPYGLLEQDAKGAILLHTRGPNKEIYTFELQK